jgi:hypothetical protein
MFCPECGEEYRQGFTECAECHVPLTDGPPPAETSGEDHAGGDLDVLVRTALWGPVAIGLAKTLLEEAGIPYFAMDQNVPARQESGNFIGRWDVRVPRDRGAEAREILHGVEAVK